MGDSIAITSEVKVLKDTLIAAESSIKLLFTELKKGQTEFINIFRRNFIQNYIIVLNKISIDLNNFSDDNESAKRIFTVLNPEADSIDALNQLFIDCQGKSLITCLEEAIFDSLILHDVLKKLKDADDDTDFFIRHAAQICSSVQAISYFIELMQNEAGTKNKLSRLRPGIKNLLQGESCINLPDDKISSTTMDLLTRKALETDPFSGGKAFRYLNDKFTAVELSSIRAIDDFFGYTHVRKTFAEHFDEFSKQKTNLPLLVCSLPGLGKTHFTISYTLKHDNLTLILPEPEDLEKTLQPLIEKLANRKDRRFIIFFDDVDPVKINWYYFRTNIGGSFSLPDNVSVVIASNFEFPANILSRGRAIKFPLFDEIRCLEMIEEFLKSRGLKHRNPNLELVIAADYLEDFGQRKFEELSPRTLIRYLQIYQSDMKKRKKMLHMTRMDVFAKPDPQVFYEFNAKLMRSLYGEEVLDALREENIKQQLGAF
jgi:predicted AAA+ superfamily ATPase